MSQFIECDSCGAKPGTPALCNGCQNNRRLISELMQKSINASKALIKHLHEEDKYIDEIEAKDKLIGEYREFLELILHEELPWSMEDLGELLTKGEKSV